VRVGRLFPEDFDLESLSDKEAERRVVQHFLDGLDDSWLVVPGIQVVDEGQDGEIDCVLVSFDHGMFTVEVKGGTVTLAGGSWRSHGRPIQDPVKQIVRNKHTLVKRLRKLNIDLDGVFVQHLVAFPDLVDFPSSGAGVECPREQILTGAELPHVQRALAHLCRHHQPVPAQQVSKILGALRPDVRDIQVDGRYVTGVSQRISRTAGERLSLLLDADANPRVFVRGPAGTGKTYLAKRWAERALSRGESTLVVCYNKFLGWDLVRQLGDFRDRLEKPPLLRVGSFHAVANEILGDLKPTVPDGEPGEQWWNTTHSDLLRDRVDEIADRFDTIIVDEGQDFSQEWLDALRGLLRDPYAGRFYIMADEAQAIFRVPVPVPEGFFVLPLSLNVRCTKEISSTLRSFGGAGVLDTAPPGPRIDLHTVGGGNERRKALAKVLRKVRDEMAIPPSHVMVLVPHRKDRDDLLSAYLGEDLELCLWKDRDETAIPCGTIQATKGLERTAVVLVDMDETPDRTLAYIGASRAAAYLAVIGRSALIEMFTPAA
jgi:hypothetical protein